jgi:PAS domain S-box-containing protein
MHLLAILAPQILDAIRKIEGWIEYAVVDNDESPLLTTAGLGMALLFGLWRRTVVPLFWIHAEETAGTGQTTCVPDKTSPHGNENTLEYHFDLNGRLIDVPPGAETLTGHSRESMIGSLFSRFLPEGDVAAIIDGFLRVLRGEDVHDLRIRLRTGDGDSIPTLIDLFPVIRSGEISAVRGTLRPLVARPSQNPRSTPRPGACVYVFRKGEMLFVNSRFEQSSGYGRRELSAVDPMQIIHPADRLRVRQSNIGYLKGNPSSSCDFRIITRDGHVKWVRARVRPVMYKGEKAVLGNLVVMPAKEDKPLHSKSGRGNTAASTRYGCSSRLYAGNR